MRTCGSYNAVLYFKNECHLFVPFPVMAWRRRCYIRDLRVSRELEPHTSGSPGKICHLYWEKLFASVEPNVPDFPYLQPCSLTSASPRLVSAALWTSASCAYGKEEMAVPRAEEYWSWDPHLGRCPCAIFPALQECQEALQNQGELPVSP